MSLENATLLDKFRVLSSQKWIPLQASLELTNRCNERCTHCYLETFEDDAQRVLKLEDWLHILEELRTAGTLFLILMGGEAMLSPYFWPIMERSSQLGFHTSMITNGLKIHSLETAQRLKDLGMNNVTLSLYSHSPEIHDRMTKVRGSHAKTVRAIEFCREAGLDISLNALLTKENIDTIFELEDWCVNQNYNLKMDPMITPKLNGDSSPTLMRASREQLKHFFSEKARRWEKGLPQPNPETGENYVCNAGKGKCAVTAYGELLPCIEIREPLGNLTQSPFAELWQASQVDRWRHMKNKDLKNVSDTLISFCDHCPGMAKNEGGDATAVGCFTKTIAEVKKEVFEAST